jgi:selenocysteine lyase/cysteine desulfurase
MGDLEKGAPESEVPFGLPMRSNHFIYDKAYTSLNHGSYGAFPAAVRDYRIQLQDQIEARPDPVIRNTLPPLLVGARAAVAPLLEVPTNEVVFVPNATTAVNAVLRNLVFEEGDVIVHFSTAYGACKKTIDYVCETTPLQSTSVMLEYPVEDVQVVQRFIERVGNVHQSGRKVRIVMFDTVLTFPGCGCHWEALVKACKTWGILSLIDGAHGIGPIDLSHLGEVGPDFFTSNCYK